MKGKGGMAPKRARIALVSRWATVVAGVLWVFAISCPAAANCASGCMVTGEDIGAYFFVPFYHQIALPLHLGILHHCTVALRLRPGMAACEVMQLSMCTGAW